MAQPNVLILRAPGTNCDRETAFAFERAGAKTERLHINRLLENPARFDEFEILCLPGGFSYGDDVAAGRILANQIEHHLAEALNRFKEAGKLILGICNGFQILIKSGVLFDVDAEAGRPATLTWNDSGQFEDCWTELVVDGTKSVFFKDVKRMYLPVAHAEGKFVTRDVETFSQLEAAGQLVLRYGPLSEETKPDATTGILPYPDNPNGAWGNVAGACDATGRVLGLMPHPERHIERTHHPRWTRLETKETGDGFAIFRNAVDYFA